MLYFETANILLVFCRMNSEISTSSYSHTFSVKVEHLEDGVFICCLVEADIAYILQQGKVDDAGSVLFIMLHQFVKLVVLLAVEGEAAVVLFGELDDLAHLVFREVYFYIRKV